MPNKQVNCRVCQRRMRSDHLKRHMRTPDDSAKVDYPSWSAAGQKRTTPPDIPTFDVNDDKGFTVQNIGSIDEVLHGAGKPPKNPKIQSLLDEIINDDHDMNVVPTVMRPAATPQAIPKNTLPIVSQKKVLPNLSTDVNVLPNPPRAIVAEVFPSATTTDILQPPEIVAAVFQEKPELIHEILPPVQSKQQRSKGDIIGFSDDEDSETESDESIDIEDMKPSNVKFLPTTTEGLHKQFNKLFCEFIRKKKRENRNELVFLLEELLRQEAISQETYTQLNDKLALEESINEKYPDDEEDSSKKETHDDEVSREAKIEKLIQSTVEYLIQPDKKELLELIDELRKEVDDLDVVQELEELIQVYLLDEFIDAVPIIDKIDVVRKRLEDSPSIPQFKQHRLKMLVDDIAHNRHRVQSIITRMADAQNEKQIMFTLKQLAREELLSEEQYFKLAQIDDLTSSRLIGIIKDTKIGRGLKFLPRKITDLTKNLHVWLEELAETDAYTVRKKISALLEELLQRNGISHDRYTSIKEENDIL